MVRDRGSNCSAGISPTSIQCRSRTFSWLWVTCNQKGFSPQIHALFIIYIRRCWLTIREAHFLNVRHNVGLCFNVKQLDLLNHFFFTITLLEEMKRVRKNRRDGKRRGNGWGEDGKGTKKGEEEGEGNGKRMRKEPEKEEEWIEKGGRKKGQRRKKKGKYKKGESWRNRRGRGRNQKGRGNHWKGKMKKIGKGKDEKRGREKYGKGEIEGTEKQRGRAKFKGKRKGSWKEMRITKMKKSKSE